MRSLTVAISLYIGAAAAALAEHHPHVERAPAPEIGAGILAFLAVGGVLLGVTLMKRLRPWSAIVQRAVGGARRRAD